MTNGRRRGRGIGGDQEVLSPFVTDKPEAETIARRGQDGYLRSQNIQISRGLIQIFEHILQFPEPFPDDDTFLAHTAEGLLAWLPASALEGAVQWAQIINKPSTLAGYGILDAYTQLQIQAIINAIDFSDTGFGNPIAGVAARSQLPVQIAYEDEVNVFSEVNTFQAGVETDAVDEVTAGAGVTVDGLSIVNSQIPELEARARFSRR